VWPRVLDALVLAKPATVVKWHPAGNAIANGVSPDRFDRRRREIARRPRWFAFKTTSIAESASISPV
jgi:hypothetical protein